MYNEILYTHSRNLDSSDIYTVLKFLKGSFKPNCELCTCIFFWTQAVEDSMLPYLYNFILYGSAILICLNFWLFGCFASQIDKAKVTEYFLFKSCSGGVCCLIFKEISIRKKIKLKKKIKKWKLLFLSGIKTKTLKLAGVKLS